MEQLVRVRACNPDGTAQVVHQRQSACSGDCHQCSGCGAAREYLELTANNPIGAKPGELVKIESRSAPVLLGAAVLYGLPVALFFLGYLLGAALWSQGALTACLAFAVGVALAVLYDRVIMKKQKTVYTITGYGGQFAMAWEEGAQEHD